MPYIKLKIPHKSGKDVYEYQLKCSTCGEMDERWSKTSELGKVYQDGKLMMTESDECRNCFAKHDNLQM